MVRQDGDREDLLAHATALVERAQLRVPGEPEDVVAGFRSTGCLSLFFGADPVYQFNTQRQLRRAFAAGYAYKAEQGRLVLLERGSRGGRLELSSAELEPIAHDRLLKEMQLRLAALAKGLAHGDLKIVAQVPATAEIVPRLAAWLAALGERVEIAPSPHAR